MTTVTNVRVTDLIKVLAEMLHKKQYFADIEAVNTEETPNLLRVYPSLINLKKDDTPLDDDTIAQLM
jgi:hypothetical protein